MLKPELQKDGTYHVYTDACAPEQPPLGIGIVIKTANPQQPIVYPIKLTPTDIARRETFSHGIFNKQANEGGEKWSRTSYDMELLAASIGLSFFPDNAPITLHTDSLDVVDVVEFVSQPEYRRLIKNIDKFDTVPLASPLKRQAERVLIQDCVLFGNSARIKNSRREEMIFNLAHNAAREAVGLTGNKPTSFSKNTRALEKTKITWPPKVSNGHHNWEP